MRLRCQRYLRKQMRRMRGHQVGLALAVARFEQQGLPIAKALRAAMLDPALSHLDRAAAGKLLSQAGDSQVLQPLLELFFQQTEKDDLYGTALTLESLNDQRAVRPLIHALLEDGNPHRRHSAARALGWIVRPGRTAALALAGCLVDPTQPQPAREEAAESLAYVGRRETIQPLISVLHDPDVRIRFWAVFGLGKSCRGDAEALRALESVLDDGEVPPGNWWSVGKEALAMLGSQEPFAAGYAMKLAAEIEHVFSDANATTEDRRWAECYHYPHVPGLVNRSATQPIIPI